MSLKSEQLTRPKIEAFLKIYPFLTETFGDTQFHVEDAIRRVNSKPELGVWCHKTNKIDAEKRAVAKANGLVTLDLQNACHCFAGRGQSSVIDSETRRKHRLLDYPSTMTYRIRGTKDSEGQE